MRVFVNDLTEQYVIEIIDYDNSEDERLSKSGDEQEEPFEIQEQHTKELLEEIEDQVEVLEELPANNPVQDRPNDCNFPVNLNWNTPTTRVRRPVPEWKGNLEIGNEVKILFHISETLFQMSYLKRLL